MLHKLLVAYMINNIHTCTHVPFFFVSFVSVKSGWTSAPSGYALFAFRRFQAASSLYQSRGSL